MAQIFWKVTCVLEKLINKDMKTFILGLLMLGNQEVN
jgi:hypothetical protein